MHASCHPKVRQNTPIGGRKLTRSVTFRRLTSACDVSRHIARAHARTHACAYARGLPMLAGLRVRTRSSDACRTARTHAAFRSAINQRWFSQLIHAINSAFTRKIASKSSEITPKNKNSEYAPYCNTLLMADSEQKRTDFLLLYVVVYPTDGWFRG